MRIVDILFYTMTGIECLLLIPFIFNYKSLDKPGKWAYYYLISSIFFAVGSLLIAKLYRNTLLFGSIMNGVQFIILTVYYYLLIEKPFFKLLIKVLLTLAIFIFLLDFFKLEGINSYNSIFAAIRTIILLSYGSIFFFQLIFDDRLIKESIFINALPNFWFNAGLFVYLCGSFLFYLAFNFFLRHSLDNANIAQSLTFVAGIFEAILFYIGIMKAKKQRA